MRVPTCARSIRSGSRRSAGETLPLSQLARVEFSSAPTEIHRYNRERAVTINADVKQRLQHGSRDARRCWSGSTRWSGRAATRYVPGGELETRTESFGGLQSALHHRAARHHRDPRAGVRQLQEHADRAHRRPVRHRRRHPAAGLTGNTISFTADDRLHRSHRHRDQELDPAGRLHQSSARGRRAAR